MGGGQVLCASTAAMECDGEGAWDGDEPLDSLGLMLLYPSSRQ